MEEHPIIPGYKYLEKISEGGFGSVWKVEGKESGHYYALKVLEKKWEPSLNLKNRDKLMELCHPRLVQIYEISTDYGVPFTRMEYCEGKTLRQILKEKKKLDIGDILLYFGQILEGVAHLHELGFVHGDLKPENIIISPANYVKIVDFGLTTSFDPEVLQNSFTQTADQGRGSLYYTSPEALETGKFSPRSDVFSLGVILYELFVGHAYPLSNIRSIYDSFIQELIERSTDFEPLERYADGGELKKNWKSWQNREIRQQEIEQSEAVFEKVFIETPDSTISSRGRFIGCFIFALMVLLALISSIRSNKPERRSREPFIPDPYAVYPDFNIGSKNGQKSEDLSWDEDEYGVKPHKVLSSGSLAEFIVIPSFSPDGKWLAASSKWKCIHFWSLADSKHKTTSYTHQKGIYSLAFDPRTGHLAAGGKDGSINFTKPYDYKERGSSQKRTDKRFPSLKEHKSPVISIHFDKLGRRMLSLDEKGTVILWERQKNWVKKLSRKLVGKLVKKVKCADLFLSEKRALVAVGYKVPFPTSYTRSGMQFWEYDFDSEKEKKTTPKLEYFEISQMALGPDKNRLIVVLEIGGLDIWNFEKSLKKHRFDFASKGLGDCKWIWFHPHKPIFFTYAEGLSSNLIIWGYQWHGHFLKPAIFRIYQKRLYASTDKKSKFVFGPHGDWLATGSIGRVSMWKFTWNSKDKLRLPYVFEVQYTKYWKNQLKKLEKDFRDPLKYASLPISKKKRILELIKKDLTGYRGGLQPVVEMFDEFAKKVVPNGRK